MPTEILVYMTVLAYTDYEYDKIKIGFHANFFIYLAIFRTTQKLAYFLKKLGYLGIYKGYYHGSGVIRKLDSSA